MTRTPAFRRTEPDARRASLIDAAIRTLARDGAGGASVRTVAREAGVSPGLIGHYFGSIEALHAAAYAEVVRRADAALEAAVEAAGADPGARLEAWVTANFAAPIADPELLATWIAVWSLARTRRDIAAEHDRAYAATRERIEALLGECAIEPDRRRPAAIAIAAMVDGLWLELCLSPAAFAPGEAAQIARAALAAIISTGRYTGSGSKSRPARHCRPGRVR